jgi:hypothetical protein
MTSKLFFLFSQGLFRQVDVVFQLIAENRIEFPGFVVILERGLVFFLQVEPVSLLTSLIFRAQVYFL